MFRPIVFVPVLTLHILVERIPRTVKRGQDAVPIIYVNGSHYDIGHVIVSKILYNLLIYPSPPP